ncbi:unnamed protein product [Toxocara canis]|uniref:Secreted protein n=1 Tax=Toxocara canis TaxID=6265 RepID=A0A183U1G5_TOXCA|nr:unnamed protein product [Toxocara canis]
MLRCSFISVLVCFTTYGWPLPQSSTTRSGKFLIFTSEKSYPDNWRPRSPTFRSPVEIIYGVSLLSELEKKGIIERLNDISRTDERALKATDLIST